MCLQVARDRSVRDWKFMEAVDVENYGSGYPGGKLASINLSVRWLPPNSPNLG